MNRGTAATHGRPLKENLRLFLLFAEGRMIGCMVGRAMLGVLAVSASEECPFRLLWFRLGGEDIPACSPVLLAPNLGWGVTGGGRNIQECFYDLPLLFN